MPRVGTKIQDGGVIILYTEDGMTKDTVEMRKFNGMSASEVIAWGERNNINIVMEGIFNKEFENSRAVSQSVDAGKRVDAGTAVTVSFIYNEDIQ